MQGSNRPGAYIETKANMILATSICSKTPGSSSYPELTIDGISLAIVISERFEKPLVKYLVPAHAWLYEKSELALAWERLLACNDGEISYVPLLVCDSDMDLGCTVLAARQQRHGDIIIWSKFGFALDSKVHEVVWFEGDEPIIFTKANFIDEVFKYAELCEWPLEY